MKSMNDLNRLVNFLIEHKMPKDQLLFFTPEQYEDFNKFVEYLGSGGLAPIAVKREGIELRCSRLSFGGFTFNIIEY